ncbi:MAG: phage Gp37/Gp68 family protein [Candidatus Methylomirabilis sp.]|nr:phage Gp37/Gp68 family protein [Candidatus Methylomirabilis sp.]
MARTNIEWTELSWNPVTGCTKISPGCQHCYAERLSHRLQAMGNYNYRNDFEVTLQEQMLRLPFSWKRPHRIFVNSMSDLFHEAVPVEYIVRVFEVMQQAHWHQFQVLTKRSERFRQLAPSLPWTDNIWMGVSIEARSYLYRIDHLRHTPAAIKFISFEPLLESLGAVDLRGIDWAIVGGESGPGARPIERSWVVEILQACRQAGVPFFFKQWGGTNKKRAGRLLDGRTWDEVPASTTPEAMSCNPTSACSR